MQKTETVNEIYGMEREVLQGDDETEEKGDTEFQKIDQKIQPEIATTIESVAKDENAMQCKAMQIVTYKIRYSANGGTGAPTSQTKVKGKVLVLSKKKPTRTGYIFQGWATTSSSIHAGFQPGGNFNLNGNITLYAVWKVKTYKITYNVNGGTTAPAAQIKTHGKNLKLSSFIPKRTGYVFQGWAISATSKRVSYQTGSTFSKDEDTCLYAVWKLKLYSITYNVNGGKGAPERQEKKHGYTITLSDKKPTRIGHTFLGWALKKDSEEPDYSPGGKFNRNAPTVLYAVWSPERYRIKYDVNGGNGTIKSQEKVYGQPLTLTKAEPSRKGYIFLGWGTSARSTTVKYYPEQYYLTDESKTLYALWGKRKRVNYSDKHMFFSAEKDFGVADTTFFYEEYYMVSGTKIAYLKRKTFLAVNFEQINDQDSLVYYDPRVVTHLDGKEKLDSFFIDNTESDIGVYDHKFFASDNTRVVYSKTNDYCGTAGFMIRYENGTIWSPKLKKMALGSETVVENAKNTDNKQSEESSHNLEYWRNLGEEEKNRISNLTKKVVLQDNDNDNESALHERIEKIRDLLPSTDNYEEYLAFIDGTGMTEDEYWNIKLEEYKWKLSDDSQEQE